MGRSSKLVSATSPKKVMPHGEFIDRIRKSFYFGESTHERDMSISRPLAEYAAELFSEPHKGHSLNRLTRVAAGKINATPCSLIMSLIYLDRLNLIDPGYARSCITPQELFIVSLMISTKFYAGYDQNFYLHDWAKEGNMTEDKLKELELEFLCAIDWNIYISNEQFFEKLSNIERTLARREGLRRGWLTYSELTQMLPSFALMRFLLNNITIMAVSYAASVMTIAGAFFLASQVPGTMLYRRANTISTNTNVNTARATTTLDSNSALEAYELDSLGHPLQSNDTNVITSNGINSSCVALNVEAELLKLEQQYCEEAKLDELRRQNLETPMGIIMLPPLNKDNDIYNTQDAANNWLALKSEYSDKNRIDAVNNFVTATTPQITSMFGKNSNSPYNVYEDCVNARNGSVLFWQLLNNMIQQTFVRVPELWMKFI